jgi:hypothetical protein
MEKDHTSDQAQTIQEEGRRESKSRAMDLPACQGDEIERLRAQENGR